MARRAYPAEPAKPGERDAEILLEALSDVGPGGVCGT
jgi:hypothetical protein